MKKDDWLKCEIIDDKLIISIGIETLAFSALNGPLVCEIAGNDHDERVTKERFSITNFPGFAHEVGCAMTDEREDGSSLLTDFFDKAIEKAVDDGSQYFIDHEYEE